MFNFDWYNLNFKLIELSPPPPPPPRELWSFVYL